MSKSHIFKSQRKFIDVPRTIWTHPLHFLACGFGSGNLPIMPGTWGTLAAIPFYLIFAQLSLWMYITITILFNVIGILLCHIANRDFGTPDHPAIVWDEFAAFFIVMIGIPNTWYYITLGFIFFRLFDIFKPWPIRWVDQHIKGGIGVMLDDILAALISWFILLTITTI